VERESLFTKRFYKPVLGLSNISRCMIHADEKHGDRYKLLVEGTDFKEVLAIPEIDGIHTVFNNPNVIAEVNILQNFKKIKFFRFSGLKQHVHA
jgi:hypothetical protein